MVEDHRTERALPFGTENRRCDRASAGSGDAHALFDQAGTVVGVIFLGLRRAGAEPCDERGGEQHRAHNPPSSHRLSSLVVLTTKPLRTVAGITTVGKTENSIAVSL